MSGLWASCELLGATAIASLLGSLHCVGMCGPFVLLATAEPTTRHASKCLSSPRFRLVAYHFGRLTTYAGMGLVAGMVATTIQRSRLAQIAGEFRSLGVAIGLVLIGIGLWRLVAPWVRFGTVARARRGRDRSVDSVKSAHLMNIGEAKVGENRLREPLHRSWVEHWGRGLRRLRGWFPKSSALGNAYFWGLTSTLLPCGWLYVFVLAALAAPSVAMSVATMAAFWLGTLPLLSLSAWGWQRLGARYQRMSGPVAGLSILLMGGYLVATRSSVRIESWMEDQITASGLQSPLRASETSGSLQGASTETSMEFLRRMTKQLNDGLPCCDPSQAPRVDKD
ncbi:sulfite exporter TauE/SafE family protein [Pirellulaceae bacterium SH467]